MNLYNHHSFNLNQTTHEKALYNNIGIPYTYFKPWLYQLVVSDTILLYSFHKCEWMSYIWQLCFIIWAYISALVYLNEFIRYIGNGKFVCFPQMESKKNMSDESVYYFFDTWMDYLYLILFTYLSFHRLLTQRGMFSVT